MPDVQIEFNRRMSEQDALIWSAEYDPLLRSTITSVSLLDGPMDRSRFLKTVNRAARTIPRLTQRVVNTPLRVAPPEFLVDEHFDLAYHLRWRKAPGDGTIRELLDYAAIFSMAAFDPARPLWEFVVIDGLEGGHSALVQKMHHALVDGVGAMKLSMAFLDFESSPEPMVSPLPPMPEGEHPSWSRSLRDGLRHEAGRQAGIVRRLPGQLLSGARHPVSSSAGGLRTLGSTLRLLRPVSEPMSPIMMKRSMTVRFDTLTASLDAFKVAGRRVGGRLNDAFLAAVAGGFDRYHRLHGVPVGQLRVTMPISIRPSKGAVVAGNEFVPARFAFPIGIADPLERMAAMKDLVARERAEPALSIAAPIATFFNRLPQPVSCAIFGDMLKAIDVVASNVPGSPAPLFIAGPRLLATFGFGPLAGAATNLTLLSYMDELHIAVNSDPAAVPDADSFVACLRESIAEIEKTAQP